MSPTTGPGPTAVVVNFLPVGSGMATKWPDEVARERLERFIAAEPDAA